MEQYEDNTSTGCCHVYSYGEDTPKLLTSRKDFIKAVQIAAWCSTLFEVEILAFVFMNSHFHFVLKGDLSSCQTFGEKLMKLLLLYINRTRGEKVYLPSQVLVSTKEVFGERYLKTLICYVLRNPIDAGFKYDPREYEWSSARLYFSEKHYRGTVIGKLDCRSRASLIGYYKFPDHWTVTEDGIIDYENFVNYTAVERLYGGIRGLLVFMAIKKSDIEQMNYQCEKVSFEGITDNELETSAINLAEFLHWPKLDIIDERRKLTLAQRLRGKYGCSKKQLSRVLNIPLDLAERVLT